MAKSFFETIIASGGFAGESFDVAVGPANLGVIDVLLDTGSGALTEDAPVSLVSSGALTASRVLTITAVEQAGRYFFLSVRNSDIAPGITLTVTATTDINGGGTSLVLSEARDYLFVHETSGTWRAYQQKLSQGADSQVYREAFVIADWSSAPANTIVFSQDAPGGNELGPTGLGISGSYTVAVYRDSDDELVDVGVVVDPGTGDVTLTKTGLGADFDGRVIIIGTA